MTSTARRIVSTLAGVAIAAGCLMAIETAAHSTLDGNARFLAAAFALALAAWIGGYAAARFGGSGKLAWIVAAILAALSLVNVASFPHPWWFVPVAFTGVALAAWIASRAVPKTDLG